MAEQPPLPSSPGRVNSVEEAVQPYDPETVDNIEVGFKSEWMDSRVRFNASYFVMNYDDKQEELQLPSDTGTGPCRCLKAAATLPACHRNS